MLFSKSWKREKHSRKKRRPEPVRPELLNLLNIKEYYPIVIFPGALVLFMVVLRLRQGGFGEFVVPPQPTIPARTISGILRRGG
jgi:hypothetical protein